MSKINFFKLITTIILLTAIKLSQAATLENALDKPYIAPDLKGISAWINSQPLTLQQLRGKVVLIDFWTYSCINCVRTLPYITAWDKKYRDKGLVIIGVHSPEFPFEKNLDNVKLAVKKYNIQYPVALDNDFATWRNYKNNWWPAHYLIDKNGNVVYTHFGEGGYDVTENNIRMLLGENIIKNMPKAASQIGFFQTPETYLGYDRAERFMSPEPLFGAYLYPEKLRRHQWALKGHWERAAEKITAQKAGDAIQLHFHAKKVFLVMGSENNLPVSAKIYLNGKPIDTAAGKDVKNNELIVERDTLYELVNLPNAQDGTLEIIAQAPGLEAYAFTFGS